MSSKTALVNSYLGALLITSVGVGAMTLIFHAAESNSFAGYVAINPLDLINGF